MAITVTAEHLVNMASLTATVKNQELFCLQMTT